MGFRQSTAFYIVFIIGMVGVSLLIVLPALLSKPNEDITNRQSFASEIVVAILLGVLFLLLSQRDTEKMQDILNKIDKRETRRKQYWVNVAISQIQTIINAHYNATTICRQVLIDSTPSIIISKQNNLSAEYKYVVEWYIDKLDLAMSQLVDLIEPSLFEDISHDNYLPFREMIGIARDDIGNIDKMQHNIRLLEERAIAFSKYIERLKDELPSKAL